METPLQTSLRPFARQPGPPGLPGASSSGADSPSPSTATSEASEATTASGGADAASVSAIATRSAPASPSGTDVRTVATMTSSQSMSTLPAASALREQARAARAHSPVRDRKVAEAGEGAAVGSQGQTPDSKHTASAASEVAVSLARREVPRPLTQALDRFGAHYRHPDPSRRDEEAHQRDKVGLGEAANEFVKGLPPREKRDTRLAEAVLDWLAGQLQDGRIHLPWLRKLCRDITNSMQAQGLHPDDLAGELPASLKKLCAGHAWLERDIVGGWVDALVDVHLHDIFTGTDDWTLARSHLLMQADRSLWRPPLATALGRARFDHIASTRELGVAMDLMGQCIVERVPHATPEDLREVAADITREAQMVKATNGGLTRWRCALEPYFRGSLAHSKPEASVGVVDGVLQAVRERRLLREAGQDEARLLNLDDVTATFMAWVADAPAEQRARVHMALAWGLTHVGKGAAPADKASAPE